MSCTAASTLDDPDAQVNLTHHLARGVPVPVTDGGRRDPAERGGEPGRLEQARARFREIDGEVMAEPGEFERNPARS